MTAAQLFRQHSFVVVLGVHLKHIHARQQIGLHPLFLIHQRFGLLDDLIQSLRTDDDDAVDIGDDDVTRTPLNISDPDHAIMRLLRDPTARRDRHDPARIDREGHLFADVDIAYGYVHHHCRNAFDLGCARQHLAPTVVTDIAMVVDHDDIAPFGASDGLDTQVPLRAHHSGRSYLDGHRPADDFRTLEHRPDAYDRTPGTDEIKRVGQIGGRQSF